MTDPASIPAAWARLSLAAPELAHAVALLRAAAECIPDTDETPTRSRLMRAAYTLDVDLPKLLSLGCPTPTGWDPMARPEEVLRG